MRPLRAPLWCGDLWGLCPRQITTVLAIVLAAAVLSVVLFPAAHGSFVNTHGPTTAFRSRRIFLMISVLLAAAIARVSGVLSPAPVNGFSLGQAGKQQLFPEGRALLAVPAVLLC